MIKSFFTFFICLLILSTETKAQYSVVYQSSLDFLDYPTLLNGNLIITTQGGSNGIVYRTDGTTLGTVLLTNLGLNNYPTFTTTIGERAIFSTVGGDIWSTDGTASGTTTLKTKVGAGRVFNLNGLGLIIGSSKVYKSDGTILGTVSIDNTIRPYYGVVFGNKLFYKAGDNAAPIVNQTLAQTDGTNVSYAANFIPDVQCCLPYHQGIEASGPNLFLYATANYGTVNQKSGLYSTSDGSTYNLISSSIAVANGGGPIYSDYNGRIFTIFNNTLYIVTTNSITSLGTFNQNTFGAKGLNGRLYFFTYVNSKYELWVSDGTVSGTVKLSTFNGGINGIDAISYAGNTYILIQGNSSSDLASGIWQTDNTPAGTLLVKNIAKAQFPIVFNNAIYFNSVDGIAKYAPIANQIITFGAISPKMFGDVPFQLSATSSSGLPVSYTSSNTSVATVSGSTVTIVGVGSTTLTASQAGNANFNPAPNVQQTLTVNKGNQTISFTALPVKKNTDAPFTISATASSGLPVSFSSSNPSVATVSGNTVTIVGVGAANITASQLGNGNYNAAPNVVQTLNVFNASNPILVVTQNNALIPNGSTYDFGNITTISNSGFIPFAVVNVGTATLTLNLAGSSLTGPNAADFTLDLSALNSPITSNTLPFGIKFTPSGLGLRTAVISIASNDPVQNPYIINLQGTGVKQNQVITFNALPPKSTTDAPFNLSATTTSGLPISFASSNTAVATISGNTVTIVGAGTSTITASQAGDGNYNAATPVTQTLTVTTKQNQTITFLPLAARTFGDAPFALTATSTSPLAVTYASSNTAVATISGNSLTIVGAGTSTITASQAGNATFNAAADVPQTLTVNKANQTITFAALTARTVGGAPFTLAATGGASGLPVTFASSNTSVATVSGNTVTIVAAGTTNITASQAGNANYNAAADVVQALTINPKQNQTITFPAITDKTLGDAAFALAATASSSLAVAYSTTSDKITISGSQVTLVKAGRASITASQAGNASFNAAPSVDQSFCIKPAKPSVTIANANTETPTLTSSATAGNQWFLGSTAIAGATNATLAVTTPGIYKVQVKADDCVSDFSADFPVIVTGDFSKWQSGLSVSPNPVESMLEIHGIANEIKGYQLLDLTGRANALSLQKSNETYVALVAHLASGMYVLQVQDGGKWKQVKFIKK